MKKLMTGNEAIARGAWEAGVQFASAYPGTPSTEILENVSTYPEIESEWAPNEKVAMEASVGAQLAGARSLVAMKHVGLNVAADPLMTAAYTGVNAGMVVISADDPDMHSSQNEQDNRNYAKLAKIGMIEPSDSQEAKDYIKEAFDLSEKFDTPMLFRLTTRICHSKSIVDIVDDRVEKPYVPYEKKKKFDPIPAVSRMLRKSVEERMNGLAEYAETTELNRIIWGDKKIGIVSAGVAYQYAKEVFGENASYLKLGFTYPLPMKKIKDFASQVETLYVIEELDPFMEDQIRAAGIACVGKEKIPNMYELNPDIVRKAILNEEHPTISYDASVIANRPPTLCAGCPHRGFYYELAKKKDVVAVSDIGCYALAGLAPLNVKDVALDMGAAFSIGHGAQKMFNKAGVNKRCVCTMGDSTFFHSGMTSMLEAVYNKSNILMVVLDNRITGMTGHQENPGTGYRINGEETHVTDIAEVAKALGVKHVRTVNPLKLSEVKEAIEWGLSFDEPACLITRWPCVLKKMSAMDKEEFGNYKAVNKVDPEKCIGCKSCIRTGCPALEFHADIKKVTISAGQCVACDVCAQVCPVQAIGREEK
ncbi:MAG: indolepyruvate ferredoxin oxidoreductase subunit alpha [Lachnospiraceae bacterium]|nr:indolepyruvate ferredoxin oxidoreductase subunit alpha [Lachnospiraceae bacterium]